LTAEGTSNLFILSCGQIEDGGYNSNMKKIISLMMFLIIANGASAATVSQDVQGTYFQNMNGCFLLYNMKTGVFEKVIGEERCRERFSPCSTFKVPLAVIAFDAGSLKDENQVLKWDGTKNEREVANHDHNAKTWMRDSIVWFSQRLTPQIGEERLKKYLHAFHYGNEDMSAGITVAWLVPPDAQGAALKVSAYEQLEFMKGLWSGKLAVSSRAMQITKNIMYLETSPNGFKLNGKTGSNSYADNRRIGWFVAHIDNGAKEYIVVTNFSDRLPTGEESPGGIKAKEITKMILGDQGLW
jgi:beta-lactamase class D